MTLKVWTNDGMKRITRHQMVTFIGGVKKKIPKGVTFINGEKVVLWQVGNFAINSWTPAELQCPYTVGATDDIYGLEANSDKVVYNEGKYMLRSNVSNISSPSLEGNVQHGGITYRRDDDNSGFSKFDANTVTISTNSSNIRSLTLKDDVVSVNQSNFDVTAESLSQSSIVLTPTQHTNVPKGYYSAIMYVGTTHKLCRIVASDGSYKIYKDYSASSSSPVATISANGYSGTGTPALYGYTAYNNRFILFGAEYQATSGGSYVYSLKKVDLSNNSVTTLLDNQSSPVTAIMVDGTNLIVSVENKLLKMNISGTISDTYTSSNTMTTLVGGSGDYYYLTTTRQENDISYMNIEIVEINNFANSEVKQTDIKMVITCAFPYISKTDYICFASKFFNVTNVSFSGGGSTPTTARTASIRILNGGSGSGLVAYTNVDIRICRIKCY